MPHRLVMLIGGFAAVAVAALVLAVVVSAGPADDTEAPTPPTTVAVTTRDLVEREELDGTLGYGQRTDVALAGDGIITGLPAEGSVIERGGVIAEVEGHGVRLLFGARPLWRPLDANVTDGLDVRQLEENLVALGHATSANLTVDGDWTDGTTAAVKRWQKTDGVKQSGTVAPGDVVVLPGAARIAERKASLGSRAGSGPTLAVTGTEKVVTVDLDASRRELLPVGRSVDVELPDKTKLAGAVRSVSTVVKPPLDESKGGKSTVEVIVGLSGDTDAHFDASPVDVLITADKAEGVLTVPVDALLALAEGGYAVERVAGGRSELVGVETGASADGYVQVTGELVAGDKVVVPR